MLLLRSRLLATSTALLGRPKTLGLTSTTASPTTDNRTDLEKSKKPKSNLASHRRFEPLDMNKSSSLNMSTSSLRSVGQEIRKDGAAVQASRRVTTVRFAPPPPSSSLSAAASTKTNSCLVFQQAMTRPATASGARPGSAAGRRARSSAGNSKVGESPEPEPKAMKRSWGWTGGVDAKQQGNGDPVGAKIAAKTPARSSSATRRLPPEEKEKPLPKRGSKIKTTYTTKANPDSPPIPDTEGSRSPTGIASKTGDQKAPNSASLNNVVKVTSTGRTSVMAIGASWESLPSELQSLGLEVMSYRDNAELTAVEALHEVSAAEILLRCLSAFADLASVTAKQSPQQTVDEFLALHTALTSSDAFPSDDKLDHHNAGNWLCSTVSTGLTPFCTYSASTPPCTRKSSSTVSPAVSLPPPLTQQPVTAGGADVEMWLEAARRGLREEMRAWFLGHVERLLDSDMVGTLGQLKRVNDWLDAVGSPSEAVERVRKKIFGYLLDHVESAVVALNGSVAPGRRR